MSVAKTSAIQVRMGELAVARRNGVLRSLLGSCVGLVLYDRRLRVGGLAHIVLPAANGRDEIPGKFADTAVPELIQQLQSGEDQPLRLAARLAGGANMFATNGDDTIGNQNIRAVREVLNELAIAIVGTDLGGTQGRRLVFDVETGIVRIEVVGRDSIEL